MSEYNKLIIYDLDGVLNDSREMHYHALNDALTYAKQPIIPWDEHLSTYDGLPTKAKLQKLTEKRGLDPALYNFIWEKKQAFTQQRISNLKPNLTQTLMFDTLSYMGYKIAVASNSVRNTVKSYLVLLGLMQYVDYVVSNEDVQKNKPHPEMYWKCMTALNAIPATTLIIEDSHIGRQGAIDSGAKLLAVENTADVTLEKILAALEGIASKPKVGVPWRDSKLNVVIPMAGAGSRFANAGYTFPKPLIDVRGKPMIQLVIESLNADANYIFIVQKEHYEKYHLQYMLNLLSPGCKVVQIDGVTEGAACTVLKAKEYIDNDNRLLIVNSDQIVKWNSNEAMYSLAADQIDGGILTFESTHPKYSYVKLSEDGFVSEVVEKKVISNMATVGMYYWTRGADFVKYATEMIKNDIRVNGEFYVAPVYQEAINDGKKIKVKSVEKMIPLGTPEDLNYYLSSEKE